MTCHHPLKAYKSRERNPATGRYLVTFNPVKALVEGSSFSVPCGRCTGCKIARSREMAARCYHEAQMYDVNSFVTLTYDDTFLPSNYSVDKTELQLFMKRLRKSIEPARVRFFGVGEYGEQTLRPHYHALLFNYQPHDLKYLKQTKSGQKLYTSDSLSKVWPYGLVSIGNVTYQSAGYVARYAMKKLNGENERTALYYTRQHPLTGTFHTVEPEFALSSRRPGLGSSWFDKFKTDAFPSDFIVVDGKKHPVPTYYTKKLSEEEATPFKRSRRLAATRDRANSSPDRLKVREEVLAAKIKLLKREL